MPKTRLKTQQNHVAYIWYYQKKESLTKYQIQKMPDAEKAKFNEIRKFEILNHLRTVTDDGQYAIKTRWVVTEPDDVSKVYNLKARLCMHLNLI